MTNSNPSEAAKSVRHFNRFYTRQIGLLQQGLLDSPYTLSEARVIYELAHSEGITATELGKELNLDAGYLSRLIGSFVTRGLVSKETSKADGRQSHLNLTEAGKQAFTLLNGRSQQQIEAMLNPLSPQNQERLVTSMHTIEGILNPQPQSKTAYMLRAPQAGDLGWVVERHGALYAQEYQWDWNFEGLVAGIVSDYIKNYDPKKEHCWIAEVDGENAGAVFVVKKTEDTAKLRLLFVEPWARGMGIGKRLVEECLRFTRQSGYRKMTLWTNSCLLAARHIYAQAGFTMLESEPYHDFGQDLVSETWERDL